MKVQFRILYNENRENSHEVFSFFPYLDILVNKGLGSKKYSKIFDIYFMTETDVDLEIDQIYWYFIKGYMKHRNIKFETLTSLTESYLYTKKRL